VGENKVQTLSVSWSYPELWGGCTEGNMVAEGIAKNFSDNPLYVVGIGQGSGKGLHAKEDLTYFEATRYAAQEAYGLSGLKPKDIQIAEVHDCFSIAEIIVAESIGSINPAKRAPRFWPVGPRWKASSR
jgi:hypothetical protein